MINKYDNGTTNIKGGVKNHLYNFILIFILLVLSISFIPKSEIVVNALSSNYSYVGYDLYISNIGISDNLNSPFNFRSYNLYNDKSNRISVNIDYSIVNDFVNFTLSMNSFSQNSDLRSQINWSFSDVSSSSKSIFMYAGDNVSVGSTFDYTYGYKYFVLYGYKGTEIVSYTSVLFEIVYMGDFDENYSIDSAYGDIVSVEFGNYANKSAYVGLANDMVDIDENLIKINGYYNYISYITSGNFRFNVIIPTTYYYKNSYSYYPYSYFKTRIYDLPNKLSNDYTNGYNNGYSSGYYNGTLDGFDNGFEEGHSEGYKLGYGVGNTDSLNGQDTFKDLMFAIFDAPFNVLSNVFNFEIFGINLSSFLIAIVSLLLVSFIIRKLK